MKLIFVHGWSVTNTNTYAMLPEALTARAPFALEVEHIHLGRYISFHDEVSMEDVVRALHRSLIDTLGDANGAIAEFSCITHSTGGPVMREWIERYYGGDRLAELPLKHLIMLAPANHGSSLAALGKKKVGRIKSWFQGIEPGQRILDWLSLGSTDQWTLNERALEYRNPENGFYPFVMIGQTIDHKFYDFLNSYLIEKGSDGVIRVAGANLSYSHIRLVQTTEMVRSRPETYALALDGPARRPASMVPLGVVPNASHSGGDIGIMNSVTLENADQKPVVAEILKCLAVNEPGAYAQRAADLAAMSAETQKDTSQYMMIVFHVRDDRGEAVRDYELLLLAGKGYSPGKLKKGFFVDRQFNAQSGRLVYYVDAKLMHDLTAIGFRVTARPDSGFAYYAAAEFRSGNIPVADIVRENETLYVEIILRRRVAKNVFALDPLNDGRRNFRGLNPSKDLLD